MKENIERIISNINIKLYRYTVITMCFINLFIILIAFTTNDSTEFKIINSETDTGNAKKDIVEIYFDISGAVETPGVYKIKDGSRLIDAIALSGGLKNADTTCINQSKVITDGEKITIPTLSEGCKSSAVTETIININQATEDELMTLPGIGSKKALDIISYRDTKGYFVKKEDLLNIGGIGESTLANISNMVTVNWL